MKRINFNIKDRKFLITTLSLAIVCIFTLTIAYSALSAVLTISGNARVSAANWDIYLSNPKVTSGSVTADVPIVNGVTATFNTILNMPGDFYEFTVDIVNSGSIDAMIESVIKNPELDASQKKYLNYEVTYQNGEAITTEQLLEKDTTMPIKVRIEYRKDLISSDLPTGQVVLDLSLTLEYIQSDGSGSSVKDNGVAKIISANGSIEDIGTIVTIGDEQFYTIGTEENNVKILSMYNLYVGGYYSAGSMSLSSQNNDVKVSKLNYILEDSKVQQLAGEMPTYSDFKNPTGMQDSRMKGYVSSGTPYLGVTVFSNTGATYSGSIIESYVNNYKSLLETNYNIDITEARLITKDELTDSKTFACGENKKCSSKYPWIYSTSYWSGSTYDVSSIWFIVSGGVLSSAHYGNDSGPGVRPVIVISKDYFN